ncbi:MAG: diadenylate cyclase CdaA [Elusimicrobiota bacterium]|jgi:diadenylate cyclase|nr:diadenylate cyclase CdaA [Elusimicrobiota bacterium]
METFLMIYDKYIVNVLDVLIMSYAFYRVILIIRGTRAMQIVTGVLLLLIFTLISRNVLHLRAVTWLLNSFWVMAVLFLAIAFQNEIRNLLAQIGSNLKVGQSVSIKDKSIEMVVEALEDLSGSGYGALIAIENETGLKNYSETGILLNAVISRDLILSIFKNKNSPLHDGAIIIYNERIVAANCILPLSVNRQTPKRLGTRHRAALGLSESTDAIVIVVSEETGKISVAFKGKLFEDLDGIEVKEIILTRGKALRENKKMD